MENFNSKLKELRAKVASRTAKTQKILATTVIMASGMMNGALAQTQTSPDEGKTDKIENMQNVSNEIIPPLVDVRSPAECLRPELDRCQTDAERWRIPQANAEFRHRSPERTAQAKPEPVEAKPEPVSLEVQDAWQKGRRVRKVYITSSKDLQLNESHEAEEISSTTLDCKAVFATYKHNQER